MRLLFLMQVLFFHAGWPDDHSSFVPLATELAARGCLCGISCMPGYDRAKPLNPGVGFDWPDVAEVIDAGINALLIQSSETRVTLVLHDWGTIAGLWFQNNHPEKVPF